MAIGWCCSGEAWAAKPVKPPPDPVAYRLVELSNHDGGANDIHQLNGGVEVVGLLRDNSGEVEIRRAHYWMVDPAGNVLLSLDLQTLPPVQSDAIVHSGAQEVNNHGVAVGYQLEDENHLGVRPLLWPHGAAAPIALPLPAGASGASAASINDAGIVVGWAYSGDDVSLVAWKVAVVNGVWAVQDTEVILTSPVWLVGLNITNRGYVCTSLNSRAHRLRLSWDDEQVWEVAGSRTQLFDISSQASGINEAGTVCGLYYDGGRSWAFAMNVVGELLDLPQLPGGRGGRTRYEIRNNGASGLNNATPLQVVGTATIVIVDTFEDRGSVGVLWNVGAGAVDLDAIASRDVYPHDSNDAGWIVGDAVDTENFLLRQPVVLIPSR